MKNGILLIDKPKGITSRDVVNIICKKFNTKKIGHTGTLDPIATGLMIICVNKATSLVELITSDDKEYVATVKLGVLTDTLDVSGNVLATTNNYEIYYDNLLEVLKSFVGTYWQEVPYFSAVKVNGKRLYEYARNNEMVVLPKRLVEVKEINLLDCDHESFTFKVKVSKGTYIRSLIRDIGKKMNIYMSLKELRRTKVNKYSVNDARNIDSISFEDIIPLEDFLDITKVVVDNETEKKILNGVKMPNNYDCNMIMFMNDKNKLLAIYKSDDMNILRMFKLF